MTQASEFQKALAITLAFEGGKVDDPRDPGGRTNQGVTERVYDAYCAAHGLPPGDVFNISQADLQSIYYTQYWLPVTQGRAWPLNAVMFDAAVLSGVGQAARWIEAAKLRVPMSDTQRFRKLAIDVMDQREGLFVWLAQHRNMGWALKGWLNRLDSLRRQAGLPVPRR